MTGAPPVRIAVLGAGLIGRRHIEHVIATHGVTLAAIVDPAAQSWAADRGSPWYPDLAAMLRAERPDGVVIATPNQLHVAHGLAAIEAGIPTLIEKPIADTLDGAERLVSAAEQAGIPLLIGHHRRHNRLIQAAKAAIDAGSIGRVATAHATCWFAKPDSYFDAPWRREKGAGPVLTNLIHDIDLLRHLCGEVVEVQAIASNAQRGFAVEDTAAALLRFACGALGTITLSDTVAAPWSWEFTSGENPAYSKTDETCIMIGGTMGSIAIPTLDLWSHAQTPDWMRPIERERIAAGAEDPLALQMQNFRDVIRGEAAPVVTGREGLKALRLVAAIQRAAETHQPVRPG